MNKLNKALRILKWCAIIFSSLAAIAIPVKIYEHNYIDALIVIFIISFLFAILFFLLRFFSSMAIGYKIDQRYLYLIYEKKGIIAIEHSNVDKIKITPYRYIFILKNKDEKALTRIVGPFNLESSIPSDLNEIYSEKLQ